MAVELGEGSHKVELEYISPLAGVGKFLSVCGFGIFFILVMVLEGKRYCDNGSFRKSAYRQA